MSQALERWKTDLAARSFTHDGCETTALHVKNARKVRRGSHIAVGKPTEHQKIDAMVSDVLAHEAAGDVTAAGQAEPKRRRYAATA
jgi:phage terminase large subunit-like protein